VSGLAYNGSPVPCVPDVSSGSYFSTPYGGYELTYPAAPFTVYGSLRFHF